MRRIYVLLAGLMAASATQAASLQDFELNKLLEDVARQSSVGTPRAINADILDQGYTVEGNQLINHLSVRASHAAEMRGNPDAVRQQLRASVCRNPGYRQLLSKGAVLSYTFSEHKSNRPVATERFQSSDCGLK
ncbi:quorum-sensing-regulated virulence factor family protein [Pseudomonas sp. MAP12]|uniref:Quorum-sensing-regulated virulence factor family protein n=1 Tax=Geopseudomonas aromaticivorans TaxID=2849492 RepID=A0ABS6MSM9_9GAMM|nr:quorum-sensing-regulated virulence factor family protein [Pseudomonas aromaticivorans]MBV2131565.1 quorum-sensing-regulated virulence factor family protein [Pseudomonas aromaticivorans]